MTTNSKEENTLQKQENKEDSSTIYVRRKFPIWLRLVIIVILAIISLIIGLIVGYTILGDGNVTDIFQKSTWQHIIDIVKKE